MTALRLKIPFVVIAGAMLALFLTGPTVVIAGESGAERFYGHFTGQAMVETEGQVSKRDLGVTVEPYKKGFTVEWTTKRHKADGKIKTSEYKVNFRKAKRAGLFKSAMRVTKFGAEEPLDPLQGDPYVWAQIEGDKMTIFSMLILNDGGYEMQTYDRRLTAEGMDLLFSRVRNGLILKAISARLVKQ